MDLALFDIDGTLTQQSEPYDDRFAGALAHVLGVRGIDQDWTRYPDSTDAGITEFLFREHTGRPPTPAELGAITAHYRAGLEECVAPVAVPGAAAALAGLGAAGWRVGIVTGNWAFAARWKLARAGLPQLPMTTSDDAHCRAALLRRAAAAHADVERAVYLGDRDWDRNAARAAKVAFIGVGGAVVTEHALADYRDFDRVLDTLAAATIPV